MANEVKVRVKTFIPEPYADHPIWDDKFHGDDRSFSYSGSSRTRHDITVDFDNEDVSESKFIGRTCTVDPADNCARASESGLQIDDIKWNSAKDKVTFKLTCACANPLVPGAPTIDYEMFVTVYKKDLRVCVYGEHDGFPNYEVWKYDYDKGRSFAIYTYDHGNQTAWSLAAPMDQYFTERCV